MNIIEWEFTSNNGTIDDIKFIEEVTNLKLPKDYIECVLLNNGGYPNKNTFDTENEKGKVFEYLLGISKEDDENVVSTYESLSDEYKGNTVPFGMDPFGNYICFRYSTQSEYNVILLNHEDNNSTFISSDFLEFLNKLY